ncbi:hypothetical protein BDM02DRAFT_3115765, partial [Thelephora ganbajun]
MDEELPVEVRVMIIKSTVAWRMSERKKKSRDWKSRVGSCSFFVYLRPAKKRKSGQSR